MTDQNDDTRKRFVLDLEKISLRTGTTVHKRAKTTSAILKRVEKPKTSGKFKLEYEVREDGKHFPLLHVLLDDGRVAEFKSRAIIVPEASDDGKESEVHALMVDGFGRIYLNAVTQEPVVLDVPAFTLSVEPDPNRLLTRDEAAAYVGVSLSQFKRYVAAKQIKVTRDAANKPRFRVADLEAFLDPANYETASKRAS